MVKKLLLTMIILASKLNVLISLRRNLVLQLQSQRLIVSSMQISMQTQSPERSITNHLELILSRYCGQLVPAKEMKKRMGVGELFVKIE
jgi:hypothetical protein